MKKRKKGFTIVELVIVIAVIAILAAVLIPTFSSLIRKANEAADIQAVQQMNTVLKTSAAIDGEPSNLKEAKAVLEEAGYKTTLTPNLAGHEFYWSKEYNIIMLIKVENNNLILVYPTNDPEAQIAYTAYVGTCYNLGTSTTAAQDEILGYVKSGETITLGGADAKAELKDIIDLSRNTGETFKGATLTLNEDITLSEAIDPMHEFAGTFEGNNHTISGVSIVPVHGSTGNGYSYFDLTEAVGEGINKADITKNKITYGPFGAVTGGGIIRDLTISYNDSAFPSAEPGSEYTYFGGIVGLLNGGTIENCKVTGTIYQYNRIGGIVGTALAGTIENCTVTANIYSKSVTVSTSGRTSGFEGYSCAGGLIAYVGNREKTNPDQVTVENCQVGSAEAQIVLQSYEVAGGLFGWMARGTNISFKDCSLQNIKIEVYEKSSKFNVTVNVGILGSRVSQCALTVTGQTIETVNLVGGKTSDAVIKSGALILIGNNGAENTTASVSYQGTGAETALIWNAVYNGKDYVFEQK